MFAPGAPGLHAGLFREHRRPGSFHNPVGLSDRILVTLGWLVADSTNFNILGEINPQNPRYPGL